MQKRLIIIDTNIQILHALSQVVCRWKKQQIS